MKRMKMPLWITTVLLLCLLFSGEGAELQAASKKTKTVSGITYKITNSKKKTATVSKSSKSIKKATIAATVKINGKTYKVTSISKNAFKKRSKLKTVTIGKNVKTISSSAFYGSKNIKQITINSNSLTKIGKNAFKGINSKATFYVSKAKLQKYSKLIKKTSVGWKKTMKVTVKKSSSETADQNTSETIKDKTTQYTYSVTPLTDDVCYYFYVKTDNPDPTSFVFTDEDTTMSDSKTCNLSWCRTQFSDVTYTDQKTLRVNGGYIFYSSATDGGKLTLQNVVNGKKVSTDLTVTIPKLTSSTTYLIDTYTTSSMTFFEKMDAVQTGLRSICFYSGVYVLGDLHKDTKSPYYGLSTSPHVDQTFYIQDPYYHSDSKSMLVSSLYPYRLDSVGFPSKMAAVAKQLDASATYTWNSSSHWLVDVTYNGETKSYGGQGSGGGQGITQELVKYKYTFTQKDGDTYLKRSWADLRSMITEYGKMDVPEEPKDLQELTWKDVVTTVGTEGSYVRLVLINSIFGGGGYGYTYLYDNGSSSYPGYFSNVWYDGRYFNKHEFFEKGTTFKDEHAATANIVIKDAVIPFPASTEDKRYLYNYSPIEQASKYNASTGVWSGFTRFNYDSDSNTWIASIYNNSKYRDTTTGRYVSIEDEAFKAACTLTPEEVAAMNIDRNANIDPASYYIYDMTVSPGTKVE